MMNQVIPLNEVPEGRQAVIRGLREKQGFEKRLSDLGFVEGSAVTPLFLSPSGDPRAFFLRGAVVALRRDAAQGILVEV